MRARLVAGNWKMHGSRVANLALVEAILAGIDGLTGAECVVCAPYPYLAQLSGRLAGTALAWGAQNASAHPHGAYTGEVSAAMLAEFGCRYVIVGHSERRRLCGESDEAVAAKFAAVQAEGMTPILCVGETLPEREGGRTEAVLARQLDAVLAHPGAARLGGAVLAYEPVWAIGTGRNAAPGEAQAAHGFLRARIAARDAAAAAGVRIVYGGSVKPANAEAIFAMPDVDGGLIGGASLAADEFLAIARAAQAKGLKAWKRG